MKFLMIAMMMFTSFQASANYFKAGLGFNVGGEVETEIPALGTTKSDLDNTFMSPLLLAYGFDMMGDVYGEIEVGYRQHEYDPSSTEEPTLLTGAFNVVGNAPMGGVILTGGAGAFFGSFDSEDTTAGTGTGFGLQIFGGVDFALNEDVKLGGELRYMTTVSDIGLDNNIDASYSSTSAIFNVKFGM